MDNMFNKLNDGETIIVAVSGGPDSMYLITKLLEFKDTLNLNIICAHVNHQTRKECIEEENLVKNFCLKNNIICKVHIIKKYQKQHFTEEEAREIRLNFFKELANKYHASTILTAHHGDDLIESILMKIMRGSTQSGLIGIKEYTNIAGIKLYRPLLSKTKEEIINYLTQNNIKFAIDETNKNNNHLRNRIRNNILPELKKENPNIHQKFLKFSKELEETNNYIEKVLEETTRNIKVNNQTNLTKFLSLDKYIQKEYLKKELKNYYQDKITLINHHTINKILSFLNNRTKNSLKLPDNKLLVVVNNNFSIKTAKKFNSYCIKCKKNVNIPNGGILTEIDKYTEKSNYEIHLHSQDIKLPLYITTRKPGMKMLVKNLNGSKKIKDILIDEKIASDEKDTIPIMIDSDGKVIWLLGIKKSQYDLEKNENYDIIYKYERKDTNNEKK